MDESNLYKLPKDVLVKLVATIRQETMDEMEEKYKYHLPLSMHDVIRKTHTVHIGWCKEKVCSAFCAVTCPSILKNCQKMHFCSHCSEWVCDEHAYQFHDVMLCGPCNNYNNREKRR